MEKNSHSYASGILQSLLNAEPMLTSEAPRKTRGIYGLIDHRGHVRYIGSTVSSSQTLFNRIHQRHRTGSEDASHYFSRMYNSGRMWRDRTNRSHLEDAAKAKFLRNEFISQHCRAVWVELDDSEDILGLERAVLNIAPKNAIAWNCRQMSPYEEPTHLVDETINRLQLREADLAALDRQNMRYTQFKNSEAKGAQNP